MLGLDGPQAGREGRHGQLPWPGRQPGNQQDSIKFTIKLDCNAECVELKDVTNLPNVYMYEKYNVLDNYKNLKNECFQCFDKKDKNTSHLHIYHQLNSLNIVFQTFSLRFPLGKT